MPSTIRYVLLAVLCLTATLAHGLTADVSQTFPLTDTIYGPAYADGGKLRSDGRQPVLFWRDENSDRLFVTRIDGEERVAKLVFPFAVFGVEAFDAVWTGSHFLVVAQNPGYDLIAQLVDTSGDAVGEPMRLAESGLWPRLASNGRNVLLLYDGDGVMTQLLTLSGAPVGEPRLLEQALLSWADLHLASNGDTFAALVPAGAYTPQSLFVLDATGNTVARQTLDTPHISNWALTSNGSRYFAVSAHAGGHSVAYVLEGNGTLVAQIDLQRTAGFQRTYRKPAATWTGTRWLFSVWVENGSFTRLFEVDADGTDLDLLADRAGVREMQLTNAGGQPAATWHRDPIGGVFAGAPLAESTRRVLFTARHQNFRAAATSSSGTLFVWFDLEYARGALRAGFRTHDGRWTERELITGYASAVAASDGNGFVVATSYGTNGSRIIRLDAEGNPIPGGTETFTAFEPLAIASNGGGYVVAGMRQENFIPTGNLLAAHITGSTVSPAREIPVEAEDVLDVEIASDGQRYLLSWGVKVCSPRVHFCSAERIAGVFLTGSADIDGPLLRLTEDELSSGHALEWNGYEYVLARNAGGLSVSRIRRSGLLRDEHVLTTEHVSSISLAPGAAGEVAVAWISNGVARMTMLAENGPDGQPLTIDDDPRNFPWYDAMLASIGQGRFAFVFSTTVDAPPMHGRRHVMAKIIAPALPPLPPAPVLSVQDLGATISLQWTGNALADGYRVEQRVGDGPWVEIGGWHDAGDRSLTVHTNDSPQFRVRAFNEAGAGPYSRAGGRRRAVR